MALSKQISSPKKKIPKHNKTTQPAPRTPLVCVVSLQTNKQTNKDTKNCICSETKTTKKNSFSTPSKPIHTPNRDNSKKKKNMEHTKHSCVVLSFFLLLLSSSVSSFIIVLFFLRFFFAFRVVVRVSIGCVVAFVFLLYVRIEDKTKEDHTHRQQKTKK